MGRLLTSLETVGAFGAFIWQVFISALTAPRYFGETLRMMDLLVKRCIIPVGLAVAPVGAVISLQGISVFKLFGAERMLSSFLGTAIFREYSPALASVMVAAQAGSSIAARIGTMKVRGQIDALAVMSVDPVRYVVVPGVLQARNQFSTCSHLLPRLGNRSPRLCECVQHIHSPMIIGLRDVLACGRPDTRGLGKFRTNRGPSSETRLR